MTRWNKILDTQDNVIKTVQFAVGMLPSTKFESCFVGNGSNPVRQLVRNGKTRARSLARKALRRRKILSRYNLPKV